MIKYVRVGHFEQHEQGIPARGRCGAWLGLVVQGRLMWTLVSGRCANLAPDFADGPLSHLGKNGVPELTHDRRASSGAAVGGDEGDRSCERCSGCHCWVHCCRRGEGVHCVLEQERHLRTVPVAVFNGREAGA